VTGVSPWVDREQMNNILLAEIIGKNSAYYSRVFDSLLSKDNDRFRIFQSALPATPSMNWAAFWVSFLGPFPFFFYYRKMYKLSFALNLVWILALYQSLLKQVPVGLYIYSGLFMLFSLLFSNAVYLSCVNKKLQATAAVPESNRQQTAKRIGGTTYTVPIAAFLISIPCPFILLILIEFTKYIYSNCLL
jgi:hypothetical protein